MKLDAFRLSNAADHTILDNLQRTGKNLHDTNRKSACGKFHRIGNDKRASRKLARLVTGSPHS